MGFKDELQTQISDLQAKRQEAINHHNARLAAIDKQIQSLRDLSTAIPANAWDQIDSSLSSAGFVIRKA